MFINGFDILWDEVDDYVADIQSIRSIDQLTFSKPVTFFVEKMEVVNPLCWRLLRLKMD